MAKKWRGPELIKEIDRALDKGLARFLILTQGKLSAGSPVDTGRMASSWMIGRDNPNRSQPPEREGPEAVTITKPNFEITFKGDYYISSSLPYSERVCFDPKYAKGGRRGGAAWFTNIATHVKKDADRAFDFYLRKIR